MLTLPIATVLAAIFLAMLLDRLLGEPAWLYRHVPHPVVLIGRAISALETRWLDPAQAPWRQKRAGVWLATAMVSGAIFLGFLIQETFSRLPLAALWPALPVALLLAHRSLLDHVTAVAQALDEGIEQAHQNVARIVGRDPAALDQHGVARAAIESLAENLSDAVIAPLFWTLIGGLPGLLLYKTVNTLDSMVGYRNDRYRHFGWASARLDDLLNRVPARTTAILLVLAASLWPRADAAGAWRIVRRDARSHRSPNAGFPEAAMAGALHFRLSGPRVYDGGISEQPWVGDGNRDLGSDDICAAIGLVNRAWALLLALIAIAYLLVAIA